MSYNDYVIVHEIIMLTLALGLTILFLSSK
jgi:hypothetical protein